MSEKQRNTFFVPDSKVQIMTIIPTMHDVFTLPNNR
jgi:hypothetical protein